MYLPTLPSWLEVPIFAYIYVHSNTGGIQMKVRLLIVGTGGRKKGG